MRNNRRSHGLWVLTAPPAPQTAPLTDEIAADIVVIGGGYTGLSAALHLAEGGARVALLEASEIGFGGSGRNVGLVNAGMWLMPEALPAALRAPLENGYLNSSAADRRRYSSSSKSTTSNVKSNVPAPCIVQSDVRA